MNETDIRKYAELMRELELTGLEITDGDKVVRLERNIQPAAERVITPTPASTSTDAPTATGAYISVKSPVVGVFHASPAENAEPYVSIGVSVKKGQVLGIIEAMKLMNEITAEEDGILSEICVANGQVVEYGTELFRIRR